VRDSVTNSVHTPSSPRIPSDHARHDRLLVARFAADDAFPTELVEGRGLVETCTECAALAADIRFIRTVAAELPAPARPRDFRLSVDQAEQLRGSPIDRLLRRLTAPGLSSLRPVAAGVMSLGLALAVVGAALPTPLAAPDENAVMMERAAEHGVDVPGAEAPAEQPAAQPAPPEPAGEAAGEVDEPRLAESDGAAADLSVAEESPALRELLIYAGLLLTLLSLALLVIVTIARRRWRDPLLR
jgi:hypothetical protein